MVTGALEELIRREQQSLGGIDVAGEDFCFRDVRTGMATRDRQAKLVDESESTPPIGARLIEAASHREQSRAVARRERLDVMVLTAKGEQLVITADRVGGGCRAEVQRRQQPVHDPRTLAPVSRVACMVERHLESVPGRRPTAFADVDVAHESPRLSKAGAVPEPREGVDRSLRNLTRLSCRG